MIFEEDFVKLYCDEQAYMERGNVVICLTKVKIRLALNPFQTLKDLADADDFLDEPWTVDINNIDPFDPDSFDWGGEDSINKR